MDGRFQRAFLASGATHEQLMIFMLENYTRGFPTLERGRLPSEWLLGRFAYPSHNLADSNAAE